MNNWGRKERLPGGSGKKILAASYGMRQTLKLAGATPIGDKKLLFIIG
jgi:hypothetical protein